MRHLPVPQSGIHLTNGCLEVNYLTWDSEVPSLANGDTNPTQESPKASPLSCGAAGVQVATLEQVLVWLKWTGLKSVFRADFQPNWFFCSGPTQDLLPKPVQGESSRKKDKERPKIHRYEMWLSVSITQTILLCKDHHFEFLKKYSLVLVLNRVWQNQTWSLFESELTYLIDPSQPVWWILNWFHFYYLPTFFPKN